MMEGKNSFDIAENLIKYCWKDIITQIVLYRSNNNTQAHLMYDNVIITYGTIGIVRVLHNEVSYSQDVNIVNIANLLIRGKIETIHFNNLLTNCDLVKKLLFVIFIFDKLIQSGVLIADMTKTIIFTLFDIV